MKADVLMSHSSRARVVSLTAGSPTSRTTATAWLTRDSPALMPCGSVLQPPLLDEPQCAQSFAQVVNRLGQARVRV